MYMKFCQAKPYTYLNCITEVICGKIFCQRGKGCYAIFNTISMPIRAGGEIGEYFLLSKISTYMV